MPGEILTQFSKALVVVAHPDDEVLLAGATIALLAKNGVAVEAMSFTDGVLSRIGAGRKEIEARKSAALAASQQLGFEWSAQLGYADQQLERETVLDLARKIEAVVEELKPDLVIGHSASDLNLDHRRVLEASLVALRPKPGYCPTIVSGEIVSSSHWNAGAGLPTFSPNYFVDVTETFDEKIAALRAYSDEMHTWPHPRSFEALEALARFRGSSIGVQRAEGFELVRTVVGRF